MALLRRHLPARDLGVIIFSLSGVAFLAWAYLFITAGGMPMSDAGMEAMRIPKWDVGYFLMMFLMWAVMMVGMMVPTVIPAVLIYAAVMRKATGQANAAWLAAPFVGGYIAVWTAFSLLATAAQWALDSAALLSPMMVSNSPYLGAALLAAAGLYQFAPIKKRCLTHCRTPVHFIASHWQKGRYGGLKMGTSHGIYCLGCCWVLMLLLFVGGVMNLLWVALITVFVLLEKVLPLGDAGGRIVGLLMIAAAGVFIFYGG